MKPTENNTLSNEIAAACRTLNNTVPVEVFNAFAECQINDLLKTNRLSNKRTCHGVTVRLWRDNGLKYAIQ